MHILALDVGSSSIKVATFRHGKIDQRGAAKMRSRLAGVEVELPTGELLKALRSAVKSVLEGTDPIDAIALDTLSPALVVLSKTGRPVAGCITHQDRRSVAEAHALEKQVGPERLLKIAGNRPFPGGIASTSLLWLKKHTRGVLADGCRVGMASSLIIHQLTGEWVIDPSQAAFLGLYDITTGQWSAELCTAAGVKPEWLPRILPGDSIVGYTKGSAARRLGLPAGVPVIGGIVDTSAAIITTGMKPGQLTHNSGSTDVLALCVRRPKPAPDVLTRPVGTGAMLPERWLAVSTIAAAGSTTSWLHNTVFRDLEIGAYRKMFAAACKRAGRPTDSNVAFEPYLAGDRTSIDQLEACFTGLTLATTREEMLDAAVRALIAASRQRMTRLRKIGPVLSRVYTMGGASELADAMHAAWPGRYQFAPIPGEALSGLAQMAEQVLKKRGSDGGSAA
jgi:sugar (pentulose or hexulose) kinase